MGLDSRPAAALLVAAALAALLSGAAAFDPNEYQGSTLYIRTQSLYPPYIDYEMHNRWWDFGGSTIINANRYVRLTQDLQGRKGWLRAKLPFVANSWSIEFDYKIHGKGTSLSGDGMAFWATEEQINTQGHVLGGPEQWKGLALTFDTYDNGRHGYAYPYVAALYNDGTKKYNKDTDGKELELGGCQADIRNRPYATRARVRYIKGKYLQLELNTLGWDDFTTCFNVTGVDLPSPVYLGFTGETGGLSDNHDVISVSVNQVLKDDHGNHLNPPQPDHYTSDFMASESKGPSYFTISLVILAIGAMGFAGVKFIQSNKGTALPLPGGRRDYKHF